MNAPTIQVQQISKQYRIGVPPKKRKGGAAFLRTLASPFGYLASTLRNAREEEIIWALREVSLEVAQGEVVGLIGRNGAGKSTLLKILSRITEPTQGRAILRGRVGSLLEIGTGFHPELTGRENIYLNGSVLGMRRAEIDATFDEIVAFSGVEKFLDTQVKRYSSGMGVRLAFSVAAHLQPEILLVDEVLAVGDAAFQKKCLGKMGDVAAEGRTVLFVSHNMVAVSSLCQRVVWLDEGRLVAEGPADEVVRKYLQLGESVRREQVWDDREQAPGNDLVRLRRVGVKPVGRALHEPIDLETPFHIEMEFWSLTPDLYLDVRILLKTEYDLVVIGSDTSFEPNWHGQRFPTGLFRTRCLIPGNWLNSGTYRIACEIFKDGRRKVFFQNEGLLTFEVLESGGRGGAWFGKRAGILWPKLEWETERVGDADAERSEQQFGAVPEATQRS